jgi:hypothetical protein
MCISGVPKPAHCTTIMSTRFLAFLSMLCPSLLKNDQCSCWHSRSAEKTNS